MLQLLVNDTVKTASNGTARDQILFLLQACSVLIQVFDVKVKVLGTEISVIQPTNSLNKIQYNTNHETQFMTNIKLLHVSTRSEVLKYLGV
jgi:hypothetical protein